MRFGPRIPGTPGHEQTGDWILAQLQARADTVIVQEISHRTARGQTLRLRNFFARFRPDAAERVLLLAHWDTRPFADQVPIRKRSRAWPSGTLTWAFTPPRNALLSGLTAQLALLVRQSASEQPALGGDASAGRTISQTSDRTVAPGITASWARGVLTSFDASRLQSEQINAGNLFRTVRSQRGGSVSFSWRPPASLVRLKTDIRTTARYSYALNTTCLRAAGQETCASYVDSRRTEGNLTMDTSFPPSLSAGLQMAYVLNDERQINRKVSQLVLTAFVQLNTSVGQVR